MADKLRVLLVDDDELVLRMLVRGLSGHCLPVIARSFAEAVHVLDRFPVDVVIADQHFENDPHGTGLRVLEYVRARTPNVKRILMSGSVPDEARDDSLSQAILEKPFDVKLLLSLLHSVRSTPPPSPGAATKR